MTTQANYQEISIYLEKRRGELEALRFATLRNRVFANRSYVRPGSLQALAEAEVEAMLAYFRNPIPTHSHQPISMTPGIEDRDYDHSE